MCSRFSVGERAARPPLKIRSRAQVCRPGAQVPRCVPHSRPAHLLRPCRFEPTGLVLGDPDLNQVAADAVAPCERVECLSCQELLDDLPLEPDRMDRCLAMGFLLESPVQLADSQVPHLSTPRGALHILSNIEQTHSEIAPKPFGCGQRLTWGQLEVAMKTLLIAFVAVLLLVGGIMNKACKTHHHTWCAPPFSAIPHAKTGHV
jgi:hypothetical protein